MQDNKDTLGFPYDDVMYRLFKQTDQNTMPIAGNKNVDRSISMVQS